jgi:pyruvate dehydrogenase (quinone)
MQMNGLTELVTIADRWRDWRDPRLVLLVLNNRDLNQVTWEQRALVGDPKFDVSQRLPDVPYARYAELLGLAGARVEEPGALGPAWDAALSADRPFVLDVVCDPEVAPLPPHVTFEQARNFASALTRDPARRRILGNVVRQTRAGARWFRSRQRREADV